VHFGLRAQIVVTLGLYFDVDDGWQQAQKFQ
jgi:hypothetical protein